MGEKFCGLDIKLELNSTSCHTYPHVNIDHPRAHKHLSYSGTHFAEQPTSDYVGLLETDLVLTN